MHPFQLFLTSLLLLATLISASPAALPAPTPVPDSLPDPDGYSLAEPEPETSPIPVSRLQKRWWVELRLYANFKFDLLSEKKGVANRQCFSSHPKTGRSLRLKGSGCCTFYADHYCKTRIMRYCAPVDISRFHNDHIDRITSMKCEPDTRWG